MALPCEASLRLLLRLPHRQFSALFTFYAKTYGCSSRRQREAAASLNAMTAQCANQQRCMQQRLSQASDQPQ